MRGGLTKTVRAAILVLYVAYALSPIYLSAAGCGIAFGEKDGERRVSFGIMWVNALLTSLTDDCDSAAAASAVAAEGEDGDDLILVKKQRAVIRHLCADRAPSLEAAPSAVADLIKQHDRTAEAFSLMPPRKTADFRILRIGLSPPFSV